MPEIKRKTKTVSEKQRKRKVSQMQVWRKKERAAILLERESSQRSQMDDYQLMRNKLIPVASRCATRSEFWAEAGILPSADGTKWSSLFHAAMDLMAYEQVDASPTWVLRRVKLGQSQAQPAWRILKQLWDEQEMQQPGKI